MSKNDRLDKYLNDSRKQLNEILNQIQDKSNMLIEKQEQMKTRQ